MLFILVSVRTSKIFSWNEFLSRPFEKFKLLVVFLFGQFSSFFTAYILPSICCIPSGAKLRFSVFLYPILKS